MKTLLIISIFVFICGCLEVKKKSSELPSNVSPPSSQLPSTGNQGISDSELEGITWKRSCFAISSIYVERYLSFDNGTLTQTQIQYSDSQCRYKVETDKYVLTYIIKEPKEGSIYRKLDKTLSQISITLHRSSEVADYNNNSLCGLNDWQAGVAQDITGLNCEGYQIPSAGYQIFDIYEIAKQNSSSSTGYKIGDLRLGMMDANKDGSSDIFRPTQLETTDFYKKIEGPVLEPPVVLDPYSLTYVSDPGDYIGQGQAVSLTRLDGTFTASKNYRNGITINFDSHSAWWTLDLSNGQGTALTPGSYYNAQRFPFNDPGMPGLNFSGTGRGCNTLTGQFTIHSVEYDNNGVVTSLHVDFTQHCEGGSAALNGTIRFNALAE